MRPSTASIPASENSPRSAFRPTRPRLLQRNLIVSHCCGVGAATPEPIVRLMMALKIVSLGRGASGVRREVIERCRPCWRGDVFPLVPQQGSVGASGDLAPLAHMTAVMIGEGQAFVDGKTVSGRDALAAAGLTPLTLGPKEGLALINGTQFSTAYAVSGVLRAFRLARAALVTGALSVDAAMASTAPFRPEIQALRGHSRTDRGRGDLMALLDGSDIRAVASRRRRARAGSLLPALPAAGRGRGARPDRAGGRDADVEANAVTDNPLVLVETGEIVSGGNFHAEPVAFAADTIALALSEIGAISERRIATLVDPALNFGLPPFLTPDPGINSGFMIAEVTAAALVSENKQRAAGLLDRIRRRPAPTRKTMSRWPRTPRAASRIWPKSRRHPRHRAAGRRARHHLRAPHATSPRSLPSSLRFASRCRRSPPTATWPAISPGRLR